MRRVCLIVGVAALVGGSLGAQQHRDRRPPPRPSNPSNWALLYSTGATLALNSLGQPVITFPTNSRDSVNMLTKAWAGSSVGTTLYLTIEMNASPSTVFNLAQGPEPTCNTPPSIRPYMQADGWEPMPRDYTSMRWWSRQGYVPLVTAGTFSLAVPLTADRWGGVNGQLATSSDAALRWFSRIVQAVQPSRIGLVFGGGCSFGHGLYVSGGTATLTVTQFETR
jgi:hypothetical protein